MSKTFEDLISKVKEIPMKKVSVAVAQDSAVLEAVRAAKDRKIADAILVGDEAKIKAISLAILKSSMWKTISRLPLQQ